MKKEFVFSILLVIVVIGGILWTMKPKPTPAITPSAQSTSTSLSKTDVAKHATKDDCWVIISGNVYNVTSYIPNHSGGPEKIIAVCGADGTTAFTNREGKGPHPERVQTALDAMLVGPLAQ